MTAQDFEYICKLVQERSAIVLEDGKQYLVESRLAPIVKQMNMDSLSALVRHMQDVPSNGLATKIVEAMVTTETSFFRDLHPFESLRKVVIPTLIEKRRDSRRLNIWCAATATGQEPYTVALVLREHFPELMDWKVTLIASDISKEMLNRAREGKYSQIEVNRGLPAMLMVKYFQQHGTSWQIKEELRNMVDFQEINLAKSWPTMPFMDLVLIRNVMIYFDVATKKSILGKIGKLLRQDGYLLLGGAETTFQLDDSFRRVEQLKSGFYQLI
jgi:chemotaxis protein methyltransferase CheR